jgi:hypothetical protein
MCRTVFSALVVLSIFATPRFASADMFGPDVVATPAFSIDGGTFSECQYVVVTCATPDAEIHFTTDGRDPNESDYGVRDGDPVYVDRNMTLKAAAWKTGWTQSQVHSAAFEFVCTTPEFMPDGGAFHAPQAVRVTCASFAQVYYTTDGREPNESDPSGWRGGTANMDRNATLKARAIAEGWTPSAVKSADFSFTIAPLDFFPSPGTCYGKQYVYITCATPGVTIRYTTDGNEPTVSSPAMSGQPIYLDHSMTIKARAWHSDWGTGQVQIAEYQMAVATYSGGSGTETDPYLLATKEDVIQLSRTGGICGKNFLMTADIDLTGEIFRYAVVPGMTGCAFDGGGHVIRGLIIDTGGQSADGLGFFAEVQASRILRLTLENCSVRGSVGSQRVAGLVGSFVDSHYPICDYTVPRGFPYALPYSCTSRPRMREGLIADCHVSGAIEGTAYVGGLVGDLGGGIVVQCSSTAEVIGTDRFVGGLIGHQVFGNVQNCFASGPISGGSAYPGGLVGCIAWLSTSSPSCNLRYCYSTGRISGNSSAGGLVGRADYPSIQVVSCFWDTQSSGQSYSAGGTGKTTAQMKNISIYLAAGWDFAGETANGYADYWQMPAGGYPSFYAGPTLPGEGTASQPYVVKTADELLRIGHWTWAGFVLERDMDLSGRVFTEAPIAPDHDAGVASVSSSTYDNLYDGIPFMGTMDGRCHKVTGLTINDAGTARGYLGLFGQLLDGTVKRLAVEDCTITATEGVSEAPNGSYYVGTLVGRAVVSVVEDCHCSGKATGRRYVGGLAGYNFAGSIARCASAAEVRGSAGVNMGGLVGYNNNLVENGNPCGIPTMVPVPPKVTPALITDCYAQGPVSGRTAGGLVGNNAGKIVKCYSSGLVTGSLAAGGLVTSSVSSAVTPVTTASYWDTQTSGQTVSSGGTGKTTAEMKSQSTFADWDFVSVWSIDEGVSYPRFNRDVPRAVAGPDQDFTVPHGGKARVTLDGSGSIGPECRPLTYLWTSVIDDAPFAGTQPVFTVELSPGTYVFALVVNNGIMDSEPNTCTVTIVENQLPVAEAGPDQTLYADHIGRVSASLDGSASSDPEGKPLTYLWSWNLAGKDCNSTQPQFTLDLTPGVYPFSLVVNDGLDSSLPDTCTISVIAPLPARLMMTPRLLNVQAHQRDFAAVISIPGISKADLAPSAPVTLWPFGIQAKRKYILVARDGMRTYPVIVAFFDTEGIIASAPKTRLFRVQAETKLASGRYVVGADYIVVFHPAKHGQ